MPEVNAIQFTETTAAAKTRTQDLGRDQFLLLLTTQLKHQDPLEPMKDREFVAQLAQFNALEQMILLNRSFESFLTGNQIAQAGSLIGRTVTGVSVEGETVSGEVEKVAAEEKNVYLIVDGQKIKLSAVQEVKP